METEDQSAERELAELEVHIERLQHEAATLEQRLAQIRKLIADFAAETGEE